MQPHSFRMSKAQNARTQISLNNEEFDLSRRTKNISCKQKAGNKSEFEQSCEDGILDEIGNRVHKCTEPDSKERTGQGSSRRQKKLANSRSQEIRRPKCDSSQNKNKRYLSGQDPPSPKKKIKGEVHIRKDEYDKENIDPISGKNSKRATSSRRKSKSKKGLAKVLTEKDLTPCKSNKEEISKSDCVDEPEDSSEILQSISNKTNFLLMEENQQAKLDDISRQTSLSSSWRSRLKGCKKKGRSKKDASGQSEAVIGIIKSDSPKKSLDKPGLSTLQIKEINSDSTNLSNPTNKTATDNESTDIKLKAIISIANSIDFTIKRDANENFNDLTRVQNTLIGHKHQTVVPQYLLNSRGNKTRRQVPIKLLWNPASTSDEEIKSYYDLLENIMGQEVENEEKALTVLKQFDHQFDKIIEKVQKNKMYYKTLFSVQRRVLRSHNIAE